MADKITKIASSYDMVSIMRDIGANYFGSDLSEQRIGMFGYLTESAANMFGAAILDASNRQQEYNTCTAKKRSTLLYDGAKLNINIDNATPSRVTAYLGILTNAITNPSHMGGFGKKITKEGTNKSKDDYSLVIEKDSIINIANYNFTTEYDILIEAIYNQMNDSYSYSVKYLLEGDKDETSLNGEYVIPRYTAAYPIEDKYIQSYVKNYNKDISILLFKVNLVQVTKESTTYPIVKNDIISLTGLDFPFSNELSHFNIFYRKNVNSTWENIKAVPIYQSDDIYDEEVIFYETLHDEKKIRLTMSDFIPAYNSEIRIDIYNTMGSEVNDLLYNGDGSDIYITLNTIDERHAYTGLELNCKPISSAYGGSDTPTLEELRAKVINAKSTVNSIDTDYDLINFMKARDNTNNYVFVKKRNDIIERRYSCFMIPRLVKKDIIPTSTLDLCIPNFRSNIDTEKYVYYNFNNVNNLEIYNGSLFYKADYGYKGDKNYLQDEDNNYNGVNDNGVTFYSISKCDYNNLLNTNISNILISKDYKYPSDGNYNKDNQYITLQSYLNSDDCILENIINIEFNNPLSDIKNDASITKFTINNINSNSKELYYDLERSIFVDSSHIDRDKNSNILNKYKFKGSIYTINEDKDGLYLYDNNYLYYNLLNNYNIDNLYIAIVDNENGIYYNSDNNSYELIDESNGYNGDKYRIISINNENITINKNNGEYITDKVMYDNLEYTILVMNEDGSYLSPYTLYSDHTRYKITEITDIQYLDFIKNNGCMYGYRYINTDLKDRKLIIELSDKIDYENDNYKIYIENEIEKYYSHEDENGTYLYMNTNANSDGSKSIAYYYEYKDSVTVKDIPLYQLTNTTDMTNKYDKYIADTCLYYIQNDADSNMYINKELYYRESKNDKGDIGLYIYNKDKKSYIKQIDGYSISGVSYSVDDNGNKESITIKSGTPLLLKSDICKYEYNKNIEDSDSNDKDILFNTDDPVYKYPLLSINDFYEKNNYSDDGKIFNIDNSLMVLNMHEQILKDSKEINKYMIDSTKGLYWSKNNINFENIMKVYSLPYTIVYNVKDQISSFFLTSISKDINMNMIEEDTDNTPVNFAIDTIHIKRNSAIEKDSVYNISVTVMANGDTSKAKFSREINGNKVEEYNIGYMAGSIMLKGFIYDDNDELMGYFDLNYDDSISNSIDDMFTYTGVIRIDDSVSSSSSKYFTNMKNMYSIKNLEYTDSVDHKIGNNVYYIPNNIDYKDDYLNLRIQKLRIAIGCYYLDRSVDMTKVVSIDTNSIKIKPIIDNNTEHRVLLSKVNQGTLSYPQFISTIDYKINEDNKIIEKTVIDKYILTNVYDNSMDLVDIYTDMSNFVKSSVQINEITNEEAQGLEMIHFTDVPVIQFSQCLSDIMSDRITNIITDASYNLGDLSKQITNNFSIDYKFFRTYGPCRYFTLKSMDTDREDIPLGDLDIKIKFNLLIKTNLNISDNDVVLQLKSYIKNRIEELNNETDSDDYTIYISNIITDIENEFNDYVRSIELISINGNPSSYRIISYDKPNFTNIDYYSSEATSNDIKEYVPEYINVPLNNITIEVRR